MLCPVCFSLAIGRCLLGLISFSDGKKAAEKRIVELEAELALPRGGLEVKEKDLEAQRAEVEHLQRVGEKLEQLERAEESEAGRLRNLANALASNYVLTSLCSFFSSVNCLCLMIALIQVTLELRLWLPRLRGLTSFAVL